MAGAWRGTPPDAWTPAAQLTERALRRLRTWLMVSGILALAGGVAAIAVPAIASVAIALFVGWILVLAGVAMAIHAWSVRHHAPVAPRMANAVLSLLVGLYLVVLPLSGTVTLTFLLAMWFGVTGVLLLLGARHERGRPGAGLMALHGALSLALAVLIVAELPSSARSAIGLLVGVNLLFWGIRALVAAWLLREALEDGRSWTS
jgi:uncharacterized membrane protein HdeD (DUF308 family)